MAYSDAIETLFRRRFERELEIANIWRGFTGDESSFFNSGGVALDYFLDTVDTTVTNNTNEDSTTASEHARGTPALVEPTKKTLTIDRFRTIDELIPVHMIEQIQPSFVQSRARKAARAVADDIDVYIRGQLNASTDTTLNVTAFSTTAANWGNAAHQGLVIGALEEIRDEMTLAGQDSQLYAITSVAVARVVKDWLLTQKIPFVERVLEDAVVGRRSAIRWEGMEIIENARAGSGTGNTDDSKHTIFGIAPGENSPLRFAARTPAPRVFESEVYRGTRITDEFSYGADVIFPEYGRIAKATIT